MWLLGGKALRYNQVITSNLSFPIVGIDSTRVSEYIYLAGNPQKGKLSELKRRAHP